MRRDTMGSSSTNFNNRIAKGEVMANKQELMIQMQLDIEYHLREIEMIITSYGLPPMTITLIARDPGNDNMNFLLTRETKLGLVRATELALIQQDK